MARCTRSNYFLFLAVTATILLWGNSLADGTVAELLRAFRTGRFQDGTTLKTEYVGILAIDFPISILVAFFYYGTNGSIPGYQVFLIDAYATLQSAFVWLYIEQARPGPKPTSIAYPIVWAILWQCFGAAIALPLYFRSHLEWLDVTATSTGPANSQSAKVVPVSFLFGAVLPAIVGLWPMWSTRDSGSHQMILALWQFDPIWVSLIQAGLVKLMCVESTPHAAKRTKAAYLLAAVSSALGHVYALVYISLSSDPTLTFANIYVPRLSRNLHSPYDKLAYGPWLFLRFDLVIIWVSCISWAYCMANGLLTTRDRRPVLLLLLFISAGMVLGAGATVSITLWWREGRLRQGLFSKDVHSSSEAESSTKG